jgi:hypothetical protein
MLNKVGGETGGFCYFKKIGGKWFLYRVVVVSC